MRWNAVNPPIFKNGEQREITKFAWKKVRIENTFVWLEFYKQKQRYFEPVPGGDRWWVDGEKSFVCWYY
jgi:hypothetical protein